MQSNPLPTSTQRTGATAAFAITGLLWTLWLAGILAVITNGRLYLLLWTGSAVVLWFLVLEQLRDPKHSALAVAVKWWVFTLLGPFALAYVLYLRSTSSAPRAAQPPSAAPPRYSAPPLTLEARVTFLERRVSELQSTVDELRADKPAVPSRAAAAAPPPPPPRPAPVPPQPAPSATTRVPIPPPPAPARAASSVPPRARGFDWGRTISVEDLMG